jgi:hypothetical protein
MEYLESSSLSIYASSIEASLSIMHFMSDPYKSDSS